MTKSAVKGHRDKAMALSVGGKLYELMKIMNKTTLTKEEYVGVVRKWYKDHARLWDQDIEDGFKQSFDYMDTDNSTTINKKEIFHWLFKYMDTNGDGVWNSAELKEYIEAMAKHLNRNLTANWKKRIDDSIARIDDGVSAEELEKVFSENGTDITSLKEIVVDLSEENNKTQEEELDKFELIEELFNATKDINGSLNLTYFMHICRDYIQSKKHVWNASYLADFTKIYKEIQKHNNHNYTISRRDIFSWVFSWFDKNSDKELTKQEIKDVFVDWATSMNRTMNTGWWPQVDAMIDKIEAGVSPDELLKYF